MIFTLKNHGQENVFNTVKPIQFKIAAVQKIPSPTAEIELMRFTGSMNFHSKLTD